MWGAAIGVLAGGLGPVLAQNMFGLKPDGPQPPPLPDPIPGDLRIRRSLPYGDLHPRQRFDLLLPPSSVIGPYPGVVLFHGGGFARGSRHYVAGIARALARYGFAVLSAEYRLVPRATFTEIIDDARTMARFAFTEAEDLQVDPARLTTMGRSAGGHLALMAAYTAGLPIRGVVSEAGPTDFDPVMWDGSVRGAVMRRFSNEADAGPLSPVHVAAADAPPTLLVHGCRDRTVPFAHARILQVRLEALGVPVELVALPRTGHNPMQWRWRTAFAIVCRWLQQRTALPDPRSSVT